MEANVDNLIFARLLLRPKQLTFVNQTFLKMKKIILASFAALFMAATASAQTTKESAAKGKTVQAQQATAPKPAQSPANVNATSKPSKQVAKPVPAANPDKKVKKDGTPDMRYKENKEAEKKPIAPKKKDGTPDMRFKDNKRSEGGKK